jgi:5'-phosphate synthase pdxT subunit
MSIGVLALQGDFAEHLSVLQRIGANGRPVRTADQLIGLDALIIPGGESTTIGKICEMFGVDKAIIEAHGRGMAVWGTCAGLIYMATDIADHPEQQRLGLLNCRVKRNAFGRQVDSFETDLPVEGLEGGETRAVFIRAPYVESVGEGVEVLSVYNGKIVAVRQGKLLGIAFHPELTDDRRVQRYFVGMMEEE